MNSFFESAAPCCLGVVFFLLLFGFVAFMRYINYRETLALAEKGLVKPERRSGNGTLFWGIGFTAVGAALFLGLLPLGFLGGRQFPFGFGPWLLGGLLPMFFGLGLVLFYVLTRDTTPKEKAVATPVAMPPPVPAPITVISPTPAVAVPPVEPPSPPAEPPSHPAP